MAKTSSKKFKHDDYEIIKREVPFQGVYRMACYQLRFRLYEDGFSKIIEREVMERSPSVGILLYNPLVDCVVLIEQFRVGALANPESPWLIEIVAGSIDTKEKPKTVAKREVIEEAGCEVLDLYPICRYFVSPGACNEYIDLFCGHIREEIVEGIFGLADEGENIHAFTVKAEDAFIMLQEGKIRTSPAIITLQWLQLNREWLKQLWQK